MSTFVPIMGTEPDTGLSATLFGKTRRSILALHYGHADEAFYVRQLLRTAQGGQGAIQRELKQLSDAGIIQRVVRGRQVYYQANPQCPVFSELRGIVVKTAGIAEVLRAQLAPLTDRIIVAFVYGSVARGEERKGSDVDAMVVGDVTFGDVAAVLAPAQEMLGREVNPTVYPPAEFRKKIAQKHHFLGTVLKGPKLFLMGDERELARLAKKRLAR